MELIVFLRPRIISEDIIGIVFPAGCMAFFAILFLQSGFDKVIDWKGNLSWLKGHFEKSPLGGMVPLLLGVVTVLEVAGGLGSLGGLGVLFFDYEWGIRIGFWSIVLCLLNLLFLFFGQRMAKDYAGAAGIVPYVIMALFAIVMFTLF